MILKPKKIEQVEPIQQQQPKEFVVPEPIQVTISNEPEELPQDLVELNNSIKTCIKEASTYITDVTKGWGEFTNADDVRKAINDLFIRFNTSPKVYTKHDYLLLLQLLSKALTYLYEHAVDNLAPIAYTGDVADLIQHEYFILDCGSSTENV